MTVAFKRCCSADTIQAAGRIAVTIGNDVVVPQRCEDFDLFRGELATTALQVKDQPTIIEPMLARGNARMCVNHGDAID